MSNAVRAQGTIYFSNRVPEGVDAPVTDARTGTKLEGSAWLAQLFYSTDLEVPDGALRPALPSTPFQNGVRAGYFVPIILTLNDVDPGAGVTVQVRVWNAGAGSSFDEAARNALGIVGKSERLFLTAGDPMGLPSDLPESLRAFSVYPVPEPAASLLFVGGLLGIVLLRRRSCRWAVELSTTNTH
jgi:hypothetical protein